MEDEASPQGPEWTLRAHAQESRPWEHTPRTSLPVAGGAEGSGPHGVLEGPGTPASLRLGAQWGPGTPPPSPQPVHSPSGATSTSSDSRASPAPSEVTARTRKVYFLPFSTWASVNVRLSAGGSATFSHVLRPACCLSTT